MVAMDAQEESDATMDLDGASDSFIQPDDGSADSFVHISAVQAAGMQTLDKEQRLNYEVEMGRNGKASAVNLSAAD